MPATCARHVCPPRGPSTWADACARHAWAATRPPHQPLAAPQWRIAINIGGTSSVTFLPPWPTPGDAASAAAAPLGLDPGLGVFFMDLTVQAIDPSLDFDDDGKMARSGTVHEGLLDEFLSTHPYYQQSELPIGVGPDDFPETLFHKWRGRAHELGVADVDLLATFTELTAKQIAMACARFGGAGVSGGKTDDVLLRGGVCNNSYFVERLRAHMALQLGADVKRIVTLDDVGIDEDSWENAMYAMFGCERRPGPPSPLPARPSSTSPSPHLPQSAAPVARAFLSRRRATGGGATPPPPPHPPTPHPHPPTHPTSPHRRWQISATTTCTTSCRRAPAPRAPSSAARSRRATTSTRSSSRMQSRGFERRG